ncbi:MAG: hypothetical protein P8Y99_09115 [Calditrichaceae bacterium]
MKKNNLFLYISVLICFVVFARTGYSQTLESQLRSVFSKLLEDDLQKSPGMHGQHFIPSNVASSTAVIDALTNFIGTSVSSFPLNSTVAGLTFDFSSGRPVSTSTSLGPIFSERAQTMGSGLINFGLNFTYIDFTKMRGVNTEDLRLSFTHQDVGDPGMGDSPNEFDYIDLYMNMDINASILAFSATYGITDRIDLGVAVPMVNVKIKSDPLAIMNSYTFVNNDSANHFFGGTRDNPVLSIRPQAIDDDATGVGDIAIRAKFNFLKNSSVDLATLAEYRIATGDDENFLGLGSDQISILLISSKVIGDFAPHLNLGYKMNTGSKELDEFLCHLGYDQKLSQQLTLALDFIGEFELGKKDESLKFPEPKDVVRSDGYTQNISITNIPDYKHDNIINTSIGFKYKPREEMILIGNVFLPINDGGLRADFIPTLGMEINF